MLGPCRLLLVGCAAAVALGACGGEIGPGAANSGGAGAWGGGGSGAAPVTPSGYLLIPQQRLEQMKNDVDAGAPAWTALLANVDDNLDTLNPNDSGPENMALVYLLTGEQRYADAALAWARAAMDEDDVASDSYLGFGNAMRRVALVLNYCGGALDADARQELTEYLDRWTNEVWFDNQGSGWGLDDPGNNYHMAFLEGTAYAGYALREAGSERAQTFIDTLHQKLDAPGGVMAYLDERAAGGDWHEGANYGERSKQRLFSALSVVASMGDTNYWGKSAFFADSVKFALYQLMPDRRSLYPAGDLARDSAMPASPYERDHIETAAFWVDDAETRGLASYYLSEVTPTFDEPGFRSLIFKDMIFGRADAAQTPDALPLWYRAQGTEWLHVRTSWDEHAVAFGVSATRLIDQSHAHHDVGSFTLWKEGWLALDAVTLGHDGLNWTAGAHNMVTVAGHERRGGEVPGLVHFADAEAVTYVQVDASNLFRREGDGDVETLLDEYTRELVFVKPATLIVYDRVSPKPAGEDYEWRMHFAVEPGADGDGYRASAPGAAIAVVPLAAGDGSVHSDDDLADGSSEAYRLALAPTGTVTRYLVAIEVQSEGAPMLQADRVQASEQMEGAVFGDQVVLFSQAPFGASAPLPVTYTVPGDAVRTHTLVNMSGAVDVSVSKAGGSTTVTITSGSAHAASAEGLIRFTQ